MQVTTETVAPREVVLTIVPDPETVDQAMRQAAREISRYRPLRGYRPGRAPYSLVERTFGREAILNEALHRMASGIYDQAIQQAEVEPYQQGVLDIKSQDPLVLTVNVPLVPEVKLGDYASMHIEPEVPEAVTDSDIDVQIDMLRRQHAEIKPASRPLQMGDQVVVSIHGSVDGEEVQHQENTTLDLTEYLRPAGFAEALLGANVNDVREFSVTYPEDEENEQLAGKTVDYRIPVGPIYEVLMPEVDDSFAKTAGDFETIAALRDSIAEELTTQREQQARADERLAAVRQLIEASEITYPRAAVDREIDRAISNQRAYARRMGFSLDSYLRITNRTEADLRSELEPGALDGLAQRLVAIEYARQEQVHLTQDEGDAALNRYANHIAASYREQAEATLQAAVEQGALNLVIEDALVIKAAQRLTDVMAGRPVVDDLAVSEEGDAEAEADAPATETDAEAGEEA